MTVKVTLTNGMTVEGTESQVVDLAHKLDVGIRGSDFYQSESKGWIQISTMASMHIKNALLKQYKAWIDSLYAETYIATFVDTLINGISRDNVAISLLKELNKRSGRF